MTERENMLRVLCGEKPEWVPNFSKTAQFYYSTACTRVFNPATGYYYDPFGVEFQLETGALAGYMPTNTKTGKFELDDVTDWKKMMPKIDLSKIDWKEETEKMLGTQISLYGENSTDSISNYVVGYLWDELTYMMGFENALYSIAAEPEATSDFLDAIADFYMDVMQEQFKYFKPDMAMVMDHIANTDSLLVSPTLYRSIIKPAEKKIYDFLKDQRIICEIHVDGKIDDIIADYAEIGIKVIQPFQVFNDIEKAKRDYGMVAVGGWDAFGPGNSSNATEDEVRASVRKAMDAYAPTGNFAIWFSGAASDRKERIFWLNDEAERYGREFYK